MKLAKDVKQLSNVREAPYMVSLDLKRVFSLENDFTQHDGWPGKSDVIWRSPFVRCNRRPPKLVW
jgi:hypothetical protein